MGDFNFGAYIVPVATKIWGEPRPGATKTEIRFGDGRTVNPQKGGWWDHGAEVGGGVLDLIRFALKLEGRAAIEWFERETGVSLPPSDKPRNPAMRSNHGGGNSSNGASRPAAPARPNPAPKVEKRPDPEWDLSKPTKVFDYVDEAGGLVLQVLRFEQEVDGSRIKTFRQRRPVEGGGWNWKVAGTGRLVPYRLPELVQAVAEGVTVFVVEGEGKADRLWADGIPATCNPMGAGKWPDEFAQYFRGADVVILPDNDAQATKKAPDGSTVLRFHENGLPVYVGRDHADLVGRSIEGVARRVRLLMLPVPQDGSDVVDWYDAGGNADALWDLVDEAPDWSPREPDPWDGPTDYDGPGEAGEPAVPEGPFVSKFGAVKWADLDLPGEEHEWLIENTVTRGEVAMIVGPSQSGKTFEALEMAMAVNQGIPFHGRESRRGGVVYQAGEGGKGIRKRLRAYRQARGLSSADKLDFVLLPRPVDLFAGEDRTNDLIAEIQHWSAEFADPLELVVIDTLSSATPGADENSSRDVGPVLARCQRISRECRCTVVLVHHMNAGGSKPRGHTSILANLDSVITVQVLEGRHDIQGRQIREAETFKQKDGESGQKWRFVLKGVTVGTDAKGKPVTSCVVEEPDDGAMAGIPTSGEAKGLVLTAQASNFLRAIDLALDHHGQAAPPSLRLPADVRVVEWAHIRRAFEKLDFTEDADPEKKADAVRKAAKRHGELLVSKHVIMKEGDFVWRTGVKVKGLDDRRGHRKKATSTAKSDGLGDLADYMGDN